MFKVEFYKDGDLVAILPLHLVAKSEALGHEGDVEVRIDDFHLTLSAKVWCTQVAGKE